MTFVYRGGAWSPYSTKPAPSGMIGGVVRIGSYVNMCSDGSGTFTVTDASQLFGGASVRSTSVNLAQQHGQFPNSAYYSNKAFGITGWFRVPRVHDIGVAESYLRDNIQLDPDGTGLINVAFRRPGWSAGRFVRARVVGPVALLVPDETTEPFPVREFTVSMDAPDPRSYSLVEYEKTLHSASQGHLNVGSWPTPWRVTFPAHTVNPQITVSGQTIRIAATVPAGRTLTLDSASRKAKLDNGTSLYGVLSGTWGELKRHGYAHVGVGQTGKFFYRDCWV